MLGRVQIQADNVLQFLGELRIVAEFEALHPMRLQAVSPPDAAHAGLTDAAGGCHGTRTPVGGLRRLLLRGFADNLGHGLCRNGTRAASSRCILLQASDAMAQEAGAPGSGGMRHQGKQAGNLHVLFTFSG